MTHATSLNTSRRSRLVSAFTLAATLVIGTVPDGVFANQAGWLVQFGTDKQEGAAGVAVAGGGVYVAGQTQGSLGGPNLGAMDVYVRKFNTRGEEQWTRQFGTPLADQTALGALDAKGNRVVVGGGTSGSLGRANVGKEDVFVRAYDREGNLEWTLQIGSPELERVRHLAIAPDGSIFVAGQTEGQLAADLSAGATDAFVMRLNRDGTVRWLRQFGTSGIDEAIGLAVTHDGVYVTGVTTGAFPGQVNLGNYDGFVARLTVHGDIAWIKQFGTSQLDGPWKIAVSGATIFISGNTEGQFPGESAFGGNDAFLAAFELDGTLRWVRQYGTAGNENAPGLAADHRGAVVVGSCCGMLPLGTQDPAADGFARSYDADGNLRWAIQFGSPVFDNAQDVALRGRDVYIVGNTRGAFPGYVNAGLGDAYVMRMRMDTHDHDEETDCDDADED